MERIIHVDWETAVIIIDCTIIYIPLKIFKNCLNLNGLFQKKKHSIGLIDSTHILAVHKSNWLTLLL